MPAVRLRRARCRSERRSTRMAQDFAGDFGGGADGDDEEAGAGAVEEDRLRSVRVGPGVGSRDAVGVLAEAGGVFHAGDLLVQRALRGPGELAAGESLEGRDGRRAAGGQRLGEGLRVSVRPGLDAVLTDYPLECRTVRRTSND